MPNYIFSGSLTPSTGAEAIWFLKETFVAAGYTVVSSSDASTFSAGDNLSVATDLANSHAWFLIRAPLAATASTDYGGVQREWAFQRGTSNRNWRVAYSYSGSFTGSANTTTIPDAPDEVRTIGTEYPAFGYSTNALPVDAGYRCHIGVDSEEPWGWYIVFVPNGGGDPDWALLCDPMASGTFASEDTDPYVFYSGDTSCLRADPANSGMAMTVTASDAITPACWFKKGESDELYTGVATLNYSYYDTTQREVTDVGGSTTNPHNNNDDTLPVIWFRGANGGPSGPRGYKGVSGMLRYAACPVRSTADTISTGASGSKDLIIFRHFAFPWDGSTPGV
jgi:hypothetical protein